MFNIFRKWFFLNFIIFYILINGCGGNVKKELGFGKQAPDEYQVVDNRPLSMPPNYELIPPEEGLQDKTDSENPIFDNKVNDDANISEGDKAILILSKADEADPNIRDSLIEDSAIISVEKDFLDKLLEGEQFFGNSGKEEIELVDAEAERKRINEQIQSGEDITGNDIPTITRVE